MDEKVSEMTDLPGGLQDTDYVPVVRPGNATNFKLSGAEIKNGGSGGSNIELNDDFAI